MRPTREQLHAGVAATVAATVLGAMVVAGSRELTHFDAALVAYTFATLFAAFGIVYRYAMWLQRPPTRMYFREGWRAFLDPRHLARNVGALVTRSVSEFGANRFILVRSRGRWVAHMAIMWGCLIACGITFPLVWGWIHFETAPGDLETYRTFVFGIEAGEFPVDSVFAFIVFHGLVWASFLVLGGVMLAFRRRMTERGAMALQSFGEDVLPLVLLCGVSVTGLMLTVSYTWLRGYAYEFLAILHAMFVIVTMLWLPFGKLFHVVQRPAVLGVSFYKDAGARGEQAKCARCAREFASRKMVDDLVRVERELGFRYEMSGRAPHYQHVCPPCRRALFGLAQSALWRASSPRTEG